MDGEAIDTLVIPESVSSISNYAFSGSSIERVVLHDGISFIGAYAFSECDSLSYTEHASSLYLGTEDNPYYYLASVTDTAMSTATDRKILTTSWA